MEDFAVGVLPNDNPITVIMQSGYNLGYDTGYRAGIEAAQPKWISVEERLPEDDLSENSDVKAIKVFVAIKAKNGITVRTQLRHRRTLFDTRGEPFFDWEWRYSAGKITHWMPLPEPPKEDNDA